MGKRKLRSCSNCGERYGPPTGKNCGHQKKAERKEDEKTCHGVGPGPDAIFDNGGVETEAASGPKEEALDDYEGILDLTFNKSHQSPIPTEASSISVSYIRSTTSASTGLSSQAYSV